MKLLEKILFAAFFLGLFLKVAILPGSSLVIGLSLFILSILYFAFSFLLFNDIQLQKVLKKSSYDGISRGKIFGAIGTGILLSIIANGIMFELLVLPGSDVLLKTSLTGLGIIFIFVTLRSLVKGIHKFYSGIFIRTFFAILIGAFFYLTYHVDRVEFIFRNHPEYVKAYKSYYADPENEDLYNEMVKERENIRK